MSWLINSKRKYMSYSQKHHSFFLFLLGLFFSLNLSASDCDVLRLISNYELKSNKLTKTDTVVLLIKNREGDRYADIEIPFSKNEKLSNIDAWIEDANGQKIKTLKRSEINERSALSEMSLYVDNFIKYFQLKHTVYPYKLCYTYRVTHNQFVSIADWSPVVDHEISTLEARFTLSVPVGYRFRSYLQNVSLLRVDTLAGVVKSVYTSRFSKIENKEPYSVAFEDVKPKLLIQPEVFSYGIEGSTKDWKSYGDWYLKLNNGLNDLPISEKNIVTQLIKGVDKQTEIIKILYHYLQDHTRYINVSIGIGGLKSYPASYVAQNKYGDCKALTNYMKSLLEVAGIKSNFVLINRSFCPEKLIDELPSSQFNHILLAVPLSTDTVWLENTATVEPFQYVGLSIQNRKALWIDENNSHIISMPQLKKHDVELYRRMEVTINRNSDATVDAVFAMKGFEFERFNELNSDFNNKDQDVILKENMPFVNCNVIDWKLYKINRDTAQIELKTKFGLHKLAKPLGTELYFNTIPVKTLDYRITAERKTPLFFPEPISNHDSVAYSLPDGWEVKSLPENKKISSSFGSYEFMYKLEGGKIIVYKSFDLFANRYEVNQYKDFYEFYNAVNTAEKRIVILKRKI